MLRADHALGMGFRMLVEGDALRLGSPVNGNETKPVLLAQ
jgi:hypothetical protein